jgi:plastocyanin
MRMNPRNIFAVLIAAAALFAALAIGISRAHSESGQAQALDAVHAHHAAHPMQPPAPTGPAAPPPTFIKLGAAPKSVELLIIAAFDGNNGGMNFNGHIHGKAGFTIPLGWTVTVTFQNKSAVPHSAVVVDVEKVREIRPAADGPYFKGATTPNAEMGTTTKTETFTFTADEKGKYAVVCGFPGHTLAGHWIQCNVADESAKPSWQAAGQTVEAK